MVLIAFLKCKFLAAVPGERVHWQTQRLCYTLCVNRTWNCDWSCWTLLVTLDVLSANELSMYCLSSFEMVLCVSGDSDENHHHATNHARPNTPAHDVINRTRTCSSPWRHTWRRPNKWLCGDIQTPLIDYVYTIFIFNVVSVQQYFTRIILSKVRKYFCNRRQIVRYACRLKVNWWVLMREYVQWDDIFGQALLASPQYPLLCVLTCGRVDYCNSLFAGLPQRTIVQRRRDAATRLILELCQRNVVSVCVLHLQHGDYVAAGASIANSTVLHYAL